MCGTIRFSPIELKKGVKRDVVFGILSGAILVGTLCMFLVMFVVPFIEELALPDELYAGACTGGI